MIKLFLYTKHLKQRKRQGYGQKIKTENYCLSVFGSHFMLNDELANISFICNEEVVFTEICVFLFHVILPCFTGPSSVTTNITLKSNSEMGLPNVSRQLTHVRADIITW